MGGPCAVFSLQASAAGEWQCRFHRTLGQSTNVVLAVTAGQPFWGVHGNSAVPSAPRHTAYQLPFPNADEVCDDKAWEAQQDWLKATGAGFLVLTQLE